MNEPALIETERLTLHGWREDQLDDLVRLYSDPGVTRYLSAHGGIWSREECAAKLKLWRREYAEHRMGKLRVVRRSDGELLGRAGYSLFAPTGEPEIGYALFRAHWGSGYATEAAAGLRDWIFRATSWRHFIGFAHVANTASLAVLKRIGMIETHRAPFDGFMCQFHRLDRGLA